MVKHIRRFLGALGALVLLTALCILPAAASGGEAASAEEAEGGSPAAENALVPDTAGKITIDGSAKDWDAARLPALSPRSRDNSGEMNVTEWRIARDADGSVYICIRGTAAKGEDYRWMSLVVTQGNVTQTQQINTLIGVEGAAYAFACAAEGTEQAPFVLELSLPVEYFATPRYTVSFDGVSIPAASIPVLDNVEQEENSVQIYRGITVDGTFEDWAAVLKSPVSCPNSAHPDCIDQSAVVFDGNWVYLYIHETEAGGAAKAGEKDSGRYAITTDEGGTLVLALLRDGSIRGVDGARAEHTGLQWELAIPADELPPYESHIAFGLNGEEPFISNVMNLYGSAGSAAPEAEQLAIDGRYSDWADYPHSPLRDAAAETADSAGAVYMTGKTLYGHLYTTGPAHLESGGGDFLSAFSIAFYGEARTGETGAEENFFAPRLLGIDNEERVFALQTGEKLGEGSHTFYICPPEMGPDSSAGQILDGALGELAVTVNGYRDEMEFQLDLEKTAAAAGLRAEGLREVQLRFGGLSPDWLHIAGSSSGPLLGVLLGVGVLLWLYILHVLGRAGMHFGRFLLGSVGLFLAALFLLTGLFSEPLARFVSALTGMLGKLTGSFTAYSKYAVLFTPLSAGAFTLKVDLECTGILEIFAFVSILLFWRAYRPYERLFLSVAGVAWLLLANALRLTLICLSLHFFGESAYFLAHAVVGRLLFYGLSVLLYFAVFARPRLIRTRVSNGVYGRS